MQRKISTSFSMQHKAQSEDPDKNQITHQMPHVFEETLQNYEQYFQEQSSRLSEFHRRLLIICTGGTISMFQSENEGLKVQKGAMDHFLRENPYFCDQDFTFFNSEDDFLITPETIFKKRIWYKVHELDDPIDSSNMNCEYYIKIAEIVESNYSLYDGFIILHGTDTLAYTTSALSFMFENLTKTVIVTGSMLPLSAMRNDGFSNLLTSITVAGHFTIPEVLLVFADRLFRGNRSTKQDTQSISAFDSPNMPPLGTIMGMQINITWDKILKSDASRPFSVQKKLCDKIAVVKFYPYISSDTLQSVFCSKETRAIVLETYGLGDMPTNRPEIKQMIDEAVQKRKVIIVNVSQCYRAAVRDDVYETGIFLQKLGVIPGQDMTVEAALSKLAYLIGKYGDDTEMVKKCILQDLRGELTPRQQQNLFQLQNQHLFQSLLFGNKFDGNAKDQQQSQDQFSLKFDNINNSNNNNNSDIFRAMILPNIACQVLHKAQQLSDFSDLSHVLQQLKAQGTQFFTPNYDQRTSLHFAAINGNEESLSFLLDQLDTIKESVKFTKKEEEDDFNQDYILQEINNDENNNNNQKIEKPKKKQKKSQKIQFINQKDVFGQSALFYAVISKNKSIIQKLKDRGGKIKASKQKIIQHLFTSIKNNDLQILECFLLAGLKNWENYGNIDKRNVGHIAVAENKIEIIQFLKEKCQFQFNQQDIFGRTPLQEAKLNNFQEIIQYLEQKQQ